MGAPIIMRARTFVLFAALSIAAIVSAEEKKKEAEVETGEDSDACWACTDKSEALCNKECETACIAKNPDKSRLAYQKCFDKCEEPCSKKYFDDHCAKLCEDGPEPTAEEGRKLIKENEIELEKEMAEKNKEDGITGDGLDAKDDEKDEDEL